jgi:hypothetical protein
MEVEGNIGSEALDRDGVDRQKGEDCEGVIERDESDNDDVRVRLVEREWEWEEEGEREVYQFEPPIRVWTINLW